MFISLHICGPIIKEKNLCGPHLYNKIIRSWPHSGIFFPAVKLHFMLIYLIMYHFFLKIKGQKPGTVEGAPYCNLEVVGSSHVSIKKIKLKGLLDKKTIPLIICRFLSYHHHYHDCHCCCCCY